MTRRPKLSRDNLSTGHLGTLGKMEDVHGHPSGRQGQRHRPYGSRCVPQQALCDGELRHVQTFEEGSNQDTGKKAELYTWV